MRKKILSILLASCMIFSASQSSIYAANRNEDSTENEILTESLTESPEMLQEETDENSEKDIYLNPYAPDHRLPETNEELVGSGDEDIPVASASNLEEFVAAYRNFMVQRISPFKIKVPFTATEQYISEYCPETFEMNDDAFKDEPVSSDYWSNSDCFRSEYTYLQPTGSNQDDDGNWIVKYHAQIVHYAGDHSCDEQYLILKFPQAIPAGVTVIVNGTETEFNEDRTAARVKTFYQEPSYDWMDMGTISIAFVGLEITNDFTDVYQNLNDEVKKLSREEVCAHTGKADEGDYLKLQIGGRVYHSPHYEKIGSDGDQVYYENTYKFEVDYYTTAEQEQELSDRVHEILQDLDLDGKSNYQKVKAIHEYICTHTDYGDPDYDEETDTSTSRIQYTAYGALIRGKSVCQGYSNLFYRMCLEAGVDTRIITGIGYDVIGSGPHGWNIVKLGSLYYNVDTTWDSNYEPSDEWFTGYFLRGKSFFYQDHEPDEIYTGPDFESVYPISEDDYVVSYYDELPDDVPSFAKASLNLGGQIGVNFLMKLPDIPGVDYQLSFMDFTVNGVTTTVNYDDTARSEDGRLFKFTSYVNAVQMADTITAVFHYFKDGEELTVDCEYTVEEYIDMIVANDNYDEDIKSLAKALADYGYYVQKYLSETNGWTLGVDHMPMGQCYTEGGYSNDEIENILESIENFEISEGDASVKNINMSLVLDSATALRLYVRTADDFKGKVTAVKTDNGQNLKVKKTEANKYRITLPNIPAHKLNEKCVICVETNGNDGSEGMTHLFISATNYAAICMQNKNASDDEKNAMAAFCRYGEEAKIYHENHPE